MTNLFAYIQTITDFSAESWSILQTSLIPLEIKKNDYLLNEGEICSSIFFISKGYCRAFYNKDGQEINTAFYFENDFVTNIKSLTRNLKSDYSILACENLTVVRFDKIKLLEAYKQSQEIETFGRKLLELIVSRQEEHADLFKLLTAQQRYEYFQNNHPEILQRVSLTQLSSYIGVTRETISRIRNKRK